ncbi:polysaccharide biosynthesis/export family protein [Sphingomonas xanthus]|uniref:Polysaccharide export protein n=1 Tax=Sphingomonas xanthus TaxID=2594473 RepID=A0A516IU96_9SPHN|nr:polysaccharide biosynthesis/export family protein [Sphingomonas xanthus]QDP20451.1 polysaccharide export protein [Sphingomonas xanthus]
MLLSACGGGIGLDENSKAVRVAQALPPPDATVSSTDFTNYRIGPMDVIAVTVFDAPELAREGAVDAAGNFAMPLIGSVEAGNKTPQQLSDAIAEKLRGKYLKNPQVAVNIKEAIARSVTVDGSVMQPGVYPVVGRMTLQQAVATAKGVNQDADIDKVIIFRTVNGQKMAAMFNLRDIRSGRYADPEVFGNDIVVVGENSARRMLRDATTTFPFLRFIPVL